MSTRQQRELAMRNSIITALARVVLASRGFVEAQASLARDDFAGDKFATLEAEVNALMRERWAVELLATMATRPAVPSAQ